MTYKAASEAHRVYTMSAFNVQGAENMRHVNDRCTHYYFDDNSVLSVSNKFVKAWSNKWPGAANARQLRPVTLPSKVNNIKRSK